MTEAGKRAVAGALACPLLGALLAKEPCPKRTATWPPGPAGLYAMSTLIALAADSCEEPALGSLFSIAPGSALDWVIELFGHRQALLRQGGAWRPAWLVQCGGAASPPLLAYLPNGPRGKDAFVPVRGVWNGKAGPPDGTAWLVTWDESRAPASLPAAAGSTPDLLADAHAYAEHHGRQRFVWAPWSPEPRGATVSLGIGAWEAYLPDAADLVFAHGAVGYVVVRRHVVGGRKVVEVALQVDNHLSEKARGKCSLRACVAYGCCLAMRHVRYVAGANAEPRPAAHSCHVGRRRATQGGAGENADEPGRERHSANA